MSVDIKSSKAHQNAHHKLKKKKKGREPTMLDTIKERKFESSESISARRIELRRTKPVGFLLPELSQSCLGSLLNMAFRIRRIYRYNHAIKKIIIPKLIKNHDKLG